MAENTRPRFGFVIVAALMAASLAVLNFGTARSALSTECEDTGGGGGGGSESPSPSPSESDEPFPPSLPPILPGESESPSPSPSEDEGSRQRCDSEITIDFRSARSEFGGAVKSDENECRSGRRVSLKKKRPGPDRNAGQTVTNQRGRWEVTVPDAKGSYYAKTPQQNVTTDDGRAVCGAARSNTVKV